MNNQNALIWPIITLNLTPHRYRFGNLLSNKAEQNKYLTNDIEQSIQILII